MGEGTGVSYFDETGFGEVDAEDENLVIYVSVLTKSRVVDENYTIATDYLLLKGSYRIC